MMKFPLALAFFLGLAALFDMDAVSDEPLLDRYWRVVEIDGKAVKVVGNHAEPHVDSGCSAAERTWFGWLQSL
jgi:hypothetical protein